MNVPETRYAKSGDAHIAYQVAGEGPFDVVYVPGWVSHVEEAWEEPNYRRMLERLASFSRLLFFDKRGTGLSDPVPVSDLPTIEMRMDDVRAVMDAAGLERAALLGHSEGGVMSLVFAATYPERTTALVTIGTYAKRIWSPDYPWAPTPEQRQATYDDVERTWGTQVDLSYFAPSMAGDAGFERDMARYFRRSASPQAALALLRMNTQTDIRDVLPAIHVPTLVMNRIDDRDVMVDPVQDERRNVDRREHVADIGLRVHPEQRDGGLWTRAPAEVPRHISFERRIPGHGGCEADQLPCLGASSYVACGLLGGMGALPQ